MKNLIDVHILHLPNEDKKWAELCNKSLENHPINIFHCDGIQDNITKARYQAFQKGSAPYVSFVDPDDIVMPGAFQKCLDVIEQYPEVCGVYTLSELIDKDGKVLKIIHPFREWSLEVMEKGKPTEIHQLVVMRREDVMNIYETRYDELPIIRFEMIRLYEFLGKIKPWKAIDFIGYQWRQHRNCTHLTNFKR